MFQSPRCQSPPISQFSKASRTPLSRGLSGQRAEDLGKPRHGFRDRLVHHPARKPGDNVRPKQAGDVDQLFPGVARGAGHFVVGQRIAVHADARHDGPAVAQGLLHFRGHPRQVGPAEVLPKGDRERLETVGEDLADVIGGPLGNVPLHQRADADLLGRQSPRRRFPGGLRLSPVGRRQPCQRGRRNPAVAHALDKTSTRHGIAHRRPSFPTVRPGIAAGLGAGRTEIINSLPLPGCQPGGARFSLWRGGALSRAVAGSGDPRRRARPGPS